MPCFFKTITGFACPSCGITRMFISLLNLDFICAFKFNPLMFIFLFYGMFLLVLFNFKAIFKKGEKLIKILCNNYILVFCIIMLLVFTVLRNIA
ncbi:MAG: DUF2752 domain-containing protein [Oscillospiraceae bacterium]